MSKSRNTSAGPARLMTDARLRELADWYADPVRKLPRKVVSDVLALIGALRALLPTPEAKDEPERVLCKHFQAAKLRTAVEAEPRGWVCARCAPDWPGQSRRTP